MRVSQQKKTWKYFLESTCSVIAITSTLWYLMSTKKSYVLKQTCSLNALCYLAALATQQPYVLTQPAFTCSKLRIETLDKVQNVFKVNNKDFIANFKHISHLVHVIAGWVKGTSRGLDFTLKIIA